jgi:hypothetical protein
VAVTWTRLARGERGRGEERGEEDAEYDGLDAVRTRLTPSTIGDRGPRGQGPLVPFFRAHRR